MSKTPSLIKVFTMGKLKSGDGEFLGWKKLPGPDQIIEGRFSDGTIVYRRTNRGAKGLLKPASSSTRPTDME